MFCGAGGATAGIVRSKFADVIWAINHDEKCIKAHKANHPETKHYTEDITELDVSVLAPVDILWASIECTNYSNAKGGGARDADSRMLAFQLFRYALHCNPDFIIIENVREFLAWGEH